MSDRSELRAQVWDFSGARCEHPVLVGGMPHRAGHPDDAGYMIGRCQDQATELAHIVPRGMGHKGDRDRLDNVMAACPLHARSTDDLSHQAWDGVPGWRSHVIDGEEVAPLMTRRQALAHYVNKQRRLAGVDVEASA